MSSVTNWQLWDDLHLINHTIVDVDGDAFDGRIREGKNSDVSGWEDSFKWFFGRSQIKSVLRVRHHYQREVGREGLVREGLQEAEIFEMIDTLWDWDKLD